MKPVRWGVIGSAMIAVERVIPAMQASFGCDIQAIASRDFNRAQAVAERFEIPTAYASYDELLADPNVEAVYNPLPNHLHREWTERCLAAGKHVLCEKPIGMDEAEVRALIKARDRSGRLVEEAFMVRDHPQWSRLRELMADQEGFGQLRSVQLAYAYHNINPNDIRNAVHTGGGALYDLGCYCCAVARLIFQQEPRRGFAAMSVDPSFGTDRLTSAILDFPAGHAVFTVATQASRYQLVQVVGSKGWIRVEVPFAHPESLPARLSYGVDVVPGTEPSGMESLVPVNQYTLQGERFSRLVRGLPASTWPLEDSALNMRTLDMLRRSAASGQMESVRKWRN